MSVRLVWHGDRVKRQIGQRLLTRLRNAATEAKERLKQKVSRPYPPSGPPGGYPAMRTGLFRRSIRYRIRKERFTVTFFSDAPYAEHLEWGTRFVRARPAFRLMLRWFGTMIERVFPGEGSVE